MKNPYIPTLFAVFACASISAADLSEQYLERVEPLMDFYCAHCHSDGDSKGNFSFQGFTGRMEDSQMAERWHEVINVINEGVMPPADEDQPTEEEKLAIVTWVQEELHRKELEAAGSGRGILRRMNNLQYARTMEEMFGVVPPEIEAFALDGKLGGLDNQAGGLYMSPVQLEAYLDAAEQFFGLLLPTESKPTWKVEFKGDEMEYNPNLLSAAWLHPDMRKAYQRRLKQWKELSEEERKLKEKPQLAGIDLLERVDWAHAHDHPNEIIPGVGQILYHPHGFDLQGQGNTRGASLMMPLDVPEDGWYRVRIKAGTKPPTLYDRTVQSVQMHRWGEGRGGDQTHAREPYFTVEVEASAEDPEWIEQLVYLEKGEARYYLHRGTMGWESAVSTTQAVNNMWDLRIERKDYFRGLLISKVEVSGPVIPEQAETFFFGANGISAPYTLEKLRTILHRVAERAFRRPVDPAETERYARFGTPEMDRGAFIRALRIGSSMIFASPRFVYLVEGSEGMETAKGQLLDSYELASRLSYFLWNRAPDERLLALAESGEIHEEAMLRAEVRRMLADERADTFLHDFTDGWMGLDRIHETDPDTRQYHLYTSNMNELLKNQTRTFFETIVREDRSILDFLDSDWTMLNEPLAIYYELKDMNLKGRKLRPVKLDEVDTVRRGGVMGQASVLTMTSNGTRTSPIVRGAWVMEHLLGDLPPPPPPNVPALEDQVVENQDQLTVKQLLEAHKKNPSCASCHARIDPWGVAFENYDAVGRWREHEEKMTIYDNPDYPQRPSFQFNEGGRIDAAGELFDGTPFNGPAEMKQLLMERKEGFAEHFVKKLFSYALGRPAGFGDNIEVRRLTQTLQEADYRVQPLLEEMVLSATFARK